jgi:hypothetical protein
VSEDDTRDSIAVVFERLGNRQAAAGAGSTNAISVDEMW